MNSILSLRPTIGREEALRRFRPPGLAGLLRSAQCGPLRRVADAFVPFRIYRVEVENGAVRQSQLLASDAVRGTLDLYSFERVPEASDLVQIETRNALPAQLEEVRSREAVIDGVRRMVYRSGFARLRGLKINAERVALDFHVPYWLGFSGSGDVARIAVLDAVRCRLEGAKARTLFESWLTS